MARRRYGRRRGHGMRKLPILTLAAVGVPIAFAMGEAAKYGWQGGLAGYVKSYTGYNFQTNTFDAKDMLVGWGPLAVVGLAKKVILPFVGRPRLGPLPISLS